MPCLPFIEDGTIYFPAYMGCVMVMGLNDHALPLTSLMLRKCHQDQPFLKATKIQKFQISTNYQLQLKGTSLCIAAGDVAEVAYSDAHRWRSLTMQKCTVADSSLSQWRFVKP